MYMPPQFNAKDPAIALELMRSHPFASLISNDPDGLPFVTHLPLVAEAGESDQLALWGHCAKPNPHWRYLQARPQAVVTFLPPHSYLSPHLHPHRPPGVSPARARVPMWPSLGVLGRVEARLIEEPTEKDVLLKKLIGEHEPAYAQQWRDLGEEFQRKMLNGIV